MYTYQQCIAVSGAQIVKVVTSEPEGLEFESPYFRTTSPT